MKALVYTGPGSLDYRTVADPEPAGDNLIRIAHVGICGSDMHAWAGHDERRPAPLILGHEAAGTVVSGPLEGKRVTINPLITCGVCPACLGGRENLCPHRQIISMPPREGAFAEFVAMPTQNLVVVPDGVPTEKACLTEPLACGWHSVRLAERALDMPSPDISALVIGGGAIGLGAALVLKARGVASIHIAETNPGRLELLRSMDGLEAFDPTAEAGPQNVDLVVDGVGHAATRAAASAAARPGGVIAHIGLGSAEGGLDIRRMTLQEITFIGTYTYTARDFHDTAQAILDGHLGDLAWPEVRGLAEGGQAFDDIGAGRAASPKVILAP